MLDLKIYLIYLLVYPHLVPGTVLIWWKPCCADCIAILHDSCVLLDPQHYLKLHGKAKMEEQMETYGDHAWCLHLLMWRTRPAIDALGIWVHSFPSLGIDKSIFIKPHHALCIFILALRTSGLGLKGGFAHQTSSNITCFWFEKSVPPVPRKACRSEESFSPVARAHHFTRCSKSGSLWRETNPVKLEPKPLLKHIELATEIKPKNQIGDDHTSLLDMSHNQPTVGTSTYIPPWFIIIVDCQISHDHGSLS